MPKNRNKPAQSSFSRVVKRFFFLVIAIFTISAVSHWYTKQPEKRQEEIQEKTVEYLDKGAKTVGSAVETTVEVVKEKIEEHKEESGKFDKEKDEEPPEEKDSEGLIEGISEKLSAQGGKYYYAGEPKTTDAFRHSIKVLKNDGFMVGYCEELKNPAWVCYRVFDVSGEDREVQKRPSGFKVDSRTSARVSHGDYTGSGYDRGHMAAQLRDCAMLRTRGTVSNLSDVEYHPSAGKPQPPSMERTGNASC